MSPTKQASRTTRTGLTIRVLPTVLAELPSIAALELQAFAGLTGFALTELIFPGRPAAARASLSTGAHPSTWPNAGYQWCLQTRTREFKEGAVFYSAYINDENEEGTSCVNGEGRTGKFVGYAKVSKPASMRTKEAEGQQHRDGSDSAQDQADGNDFEGVDQDVLKAWRAAQAELSARHPEAENHIVLSLVTVHPQYQKLGIGSALMSRILELADSTQTPIFIKDATLAGMPLYKALGFKQIDTLRFEYGGEMVEMFTMIRPVPAGAGIGQRSGE